MNISSYVAMLLVLGAVAPACSAGSPGIDVHLFLAGPERLEVTYTLPPACAAVRLANPGIPSESARRMRADWKALDACTAVSAEGIVPAAPGCSVLRIGVPVSTLFLDRVYPWAYPLGGGAVFTHTSAFAPDRTCGEVSWRLSSRHGDVVADGRRVPSGPGGITGTAAFDYAPVALFDRPAATDADRLMHVDPRLSSATSALARDAIAQTHGLYAEWFPGAVREARFTAVSAGPDDRFFRGDTAGGNFLRLAVPADADPAIHPALRGLVAHELAHLQFQSKAFGAWAAERTLLSEGAAEMARWLAQARLRWMDRNALRDDASRAINACLVATGGRRWQEVPGRHWGRIPYDCGLAFHLLALAGGRGANSASAPARLGAAYRGDPEGDLAHALECGADAGCRPRWLLRMMEGEPIAGMLQAFAAETGLLRPLAAWPQGAAHTLAQQAVGELMRQDCGGAVSLYHEGSQVRIGEISGCRVLRDGMVVIALQGVPLADGQRAVTSLIEACRDTSTVTLVLAGGRSVDMACDAGRLGLPTMLYEADIDGLLARLGMDDGGADATPRQ